MGIMEILLIVALFIAVGVAAAQLAEWLFGE
jgi:hypothetical protein